VAFAALMAAAYAWPTARYVDAAALKGFLALQEPLGEHRAERLAEMADPFPFGLLVVALCLTGLLIRRPRHVVAAFVMVGGANVTTQILKPLLSESRTYGMLGSEQVSDTAFPSGHATASMSLALAAVLVAPHALRPLAAALGSLYPVLVSYGFLSLGWHLPSDVVGGYLVATAWSLLAVAGLRAAATRLPEPEREPPGGIITGLQASLDDARAFRLATWTALLGVGAAATAGGLVAVAFHDRLLEHVERYTALFAVAGGIALSAAMLLAATTALTARRPR
jgi:membrane-associated phospholipid phosphatase